jgi:hypothetical protein
MTGDVKDSILPMRLTALESVQVVTLSCNEHGNLAGTRFDPAAVWSDDEHG